MMKWFQVFEPDNPMSINIAQITYIAKNGAGSMLRMSDGSTHYFHAVSYEDMMKKMLNA